MALHFDIDPRLHRRLEAAAALTGRTPEQWAREAIEEKLERDGAEAYTALGVGYPNALLEALKHADSRYARIARGTHGAMDAARDLHELRDERPGGVAG